MDERDKRLAAHLKNLQKRHERDHKERFDKGKSVEKERQEKISDAISADWNKKNKAAQAAQAPEGGKPLPDGWRDAHWKTKAALASEYAGIAAKNQSEAEAALANYEAKLAGNSAE